MTACIAGWAHTPFGRLEADDRGEELRERRRQFPMRGTAAVQADFAHSGS